MIFHLNSPESPRPIIKQQMRGYLAKNCLPILLYSVVLEDETREVELNTKHMRQETIKIK